MLQISLPFGGDVIDLVVKESHRKANPALAEDYLADFLQIAMSELDLIDLHSGLNKLKNVSKQSEAYVPWIVAEYANFYFHCLEYRREDYPLKLVDDTSELAQDVLVEMSPRVNSIGSELFTAFVMYSSVVLLKTSGAETFTVSSRDWAYMSADQEISFLNPLTESLVEFSSPVSSYIRLDVDLNHQSCYVYSSTFLAHLGALQLDLRRGSGRAQASDNFLQQLDSNRCWQLDSDNQATPLFPTD